jgi:hypothetical protein
MKKNAWILVSVLLFVSVSALAQAPRSTPPLTQEALAAILGQPAASSCAAQPSVARQAAKRPAIIHGKAMCTATCQFGGTVSCSGTVCNGVNAACSAEPGHVTCDGVTTSCPACCTGTGRQLACCQCDQTGDCEACCRCDGGTIGHCAIICS